MAIDTSLTNVSNPVDFAKGCNGTYYTKAAYLAKRQGRAMRTALGEGTLGRSFVVFRANNPEAAKRVIQVALVFWAISEYNPTYRAERGMSTHTCDLVGIGAYAHSFTEIVAEMAEPNLAPMVNHFGHNAWMLDAWDWFASNVAPTA